MKRSFTVLMTLAALAMLAGLRLFGRRRGYEYEAPEAS